MSSSKPPSAPDAIEPSRSSSPDDALAETAAVAAAQQDVKRLVELAGELERRGHFNLAWRHLADASRRNALGDRIEWDGDWNAPGPVLVHRRIRHIGAELRMARFLADGAEKGLDIVAWTEPRLVELFRRSFPAIRVAPSTEAPPPTRYATSYERIAQHSLTEDREIERTFRPLVADAALAVRLLGPSGRAKRPRIGFSWHSTNSRKDLPSILEWIDLLKQIDADWISLQYNAPEFGLSQFQAELGSTIHVPPAIDQMVDLDGFAAAVSSTDCVVTISNTTAHMAGALGKKCIVVLDDKDHLIWPKRGDHSPFYPNLTLVRPNGRSWQIVFAEVRSLISANHA